MLENFLFKFYEVEFDEQPGQLFLLSLMTGSLPMITSLELSSAFKSVPGIGALMLRYRLEQDFSFRGTSLSNIPIQMVTWIIFYQTVSRQILKGIFKRASLLLAAVKPETTTEATG
jgi:hypothetical protein